MVHPALADWTITGIAAAVRDGTLSTVEVVETALERIAADDTNAFVHLAADQARDRAVKIDDMVRRGLDPGPFAGVPVGVKDLLENVHGMPTTRGSLLYKDSEADPADSTHVARLRAAGAVIVGRTAAAEFGIDSATSTRAHGVTLNPWSLRHTPGGSSGGSAAAVAAGLVPFCTGTDEGGSIRSPASHCNLVGLKPSFGRIPQPLGGSTLNAVGGFAKTVQDAARHLDVASGPDALDRFSLPKAAIGYEDAASSLDIAGLRVGLSLDLGYAPVHDEIAAIVRDAGADLIAVLQARDFDGAIELPNPYPAYVLDVLSDLRSTLDLEHGGDHSALSEHLAVALTMTAEIPQAAVFALQREVRGIHKAVADLFDQVDLIVTPVTVAPPHLAHGPAPSEIGGQSLQFIGVENFPMWANFTGRPSISVPAGFTSEGLPVGMLITGQRLQDEVVLRAAALWEAAKPWARLARYR